MQDYSTWAKRHADIFALNTPQDESMFLAWKEAFRLAGYTLEELDEATTYMATTAAPKFRTEHLPAIQQRIAGRRHARRLEEAEIRERQSYEGKFNCDLCSGSGWVRVPALHSIKNTEDGRQVWTPERQHYPTAAVTCRCSQGWRIHDSYTEKAGCEKGTTQPLTLDDYHATFPHWQELMRERTAEARAKLAAARASAKADGAESSPLEKSLQAVAERYKLALPSHEEEF